MFGLAQKTSANVERYPELDQWLPKPPLEEWLLEKGWEFEKTMLPLSALSAGLAVRVNTRLLQEADQENVNQMVSTLDEGRKLSMICVVERSDGTLIVVDGRHTVAASKQHSDEDGNKISQIGCYLVRGISLEEEDKLARCSNRYNGQGYTPGENVLQAMALVSSGHTVAEAAAATGAKKKAVQDAVDTEAMIAYVGNEGITLRFGKGKGEMYKDWGTQLLRLYRAKHGVPLIDACAYLVRAFGKGRGRKSGCLAQDLVDYMLSAKNMTDADRSMAVAEFEKSHPITKKYRKPNKSLEKFDNFLKYAEKLLKKKSSLSDFGVPADRLQEYADKLQKLREELDKII